MSWNPTQAPIPVPRPGNGEPVGPVSPREIVKPNEFVPNADPTKTVKSTPPSFPPLRRGNG